MKFSLNWLKDYVSFKASPQELGSKLTMAGLEVEKIETVASDKVFELEITPNRADCLNVLGIAREVSAILNTDLKEPKIKKIKFPKNKVDIVVENSNDCPRYIGTLIRNVNVTSSPLWLKKRIEALGLRSINNVVDITNFCLMELGQPLHAFDYDKLEGGKITVRRAKAKEKILTLDGNQCELDGSVLVIADKKNPVAIAGIVGGKDTEVTEATKNILLESASFDPILIRRASRKLGISTDSSYRFERGIDLSLVEKGALRAIDLIHQIAGGIVEKRTDFYPKKQSKQLTTIVVSVEKVNDFLGAKITVKECERILKKLGFSVAIASKNILKIIPPSFRRDIKAKEDIIEEIARIVGYDKLPETTPHICIANIKEDDNIGYKNIFKNILTGLGFNEIVTYTTTHQKNLNNINYTVSEDDVKIQNPLTQDQEFLRPSMLPSFLPVVLLNINKGQKDLKFFEIGKIYDVLGEKEVLGLVLMGKRDFDWRKTMNEQLDFYDIKGVLERLLETAVDFEDVILEKTQEPFGFENNTGVLMRISDQGIGVFGKVADEILQKWDIKQKDIFFAELDYQWLAYNLKRDKKFIPLEEFPSITRDISIAIKKEILFEHVKTVVKEHKGGYLKSIKFIEEYLGDKIPAGYRGITFSLTYQSPHTTLRDDQVTADHNLICQILSEQLGAIQR